MEDLVREAAQKRRRLEGGEREDSYSTAARAAAAAAAAAAGPRHGLAGLSAATESQSINAFSGASPCVSRRALLEAELLRRRNRAGNAGLGNALENALVDRLLHQRQQQQQQQQSSIATALLRGLSAPSPATKKVTPTTTTTAAKGINLSQLLDATKSPPPAPRLPPNLSALLGSAPPRPNAAAATAVASATRPAPTLASLGNASLPPSLGAGAATNTKLPPTLAGLTAGGTNTTNASLPPTLAGLSSGGTNTKLPPTLAGLTGGGGTSASLLGQSFQQRLRQIQGQNQAQLQDTKPPPVPDDLQERLRRLQQLSNLGAGASLPTQNLPVAQLQETKPPPVPDDIQERLRRLQELSNLGTASSIPAHNAGNASLRPTINVNALPSRFNNSNIGALDEILKNRATPAAATKKPPPPALKNTTAPADANTTDDTNSSKNRKRKPTLLYMSCDDEDLSQYQTEVRKQIEVFEADTEDTSCSARGRNRPIVRGQVGIRCRHCKVVPPQHRQRAAIYYPSKLDRLYQMSQTIASVHLAEYCQHIPKQVRSDLARLREAKSAALGGKKYWADAGRAMGLVEIDKRLFYGKEGDPIQEPTA